jgi:Na+-driven multidrug efflux pump
MHAPALAYLRICSLGAPAATLWLVTNGIFRGLGDTATPLVWALCFTALNAVLDPLFIFRFGLGPSGAAVGTALAQALALVPLLAALERKLRMERPEAQAHRFPLVGLFTPVGGLPTLMDSFRSYVSAGSLVLLRSIAKVSAYSLCAREAARLGPVASAAHNLCFQLGVVTTQLCESVAIATQTLLARELAQDRSATAAATEGSADEDADAGASLVARRRARHVLRRGIGIGATVASALSLMTLVNRRNVVAGLTTIPEVRTAAISVMPLVLLCQVLKGLAYPVNGALMGALDWGASAFAMVAAQLTSVVLVMLWSGGGTRLLSLNQLWGALASLFAVQIGVGILRIASGTGPWAKTRLDKGAGG